MDMKRLFLQCKILPRTIYIYQSGPLWLFPTLWGFALMLPFVYMDSLPFGYCLELVYQFGNFVITFYLVKYMFLGMEINYVYCLQYLTDFLCFVFREKC